MAATIWLIAVVLLMVAARRTRRQRRRGGVGSAAVGSIYGWLNEDKRKAVEIVVDGQAEARDPEHRDGNLPDLANPRRGLVATNHRADRESPIHPESLR